MFGFLKDKLKQAVKSFSKTAEQETVEEKTNDQKQIAEAKEHEKKLLEKQKTQKPKNASKKPDHKEKIPAKTSGKKQHEPALKEHQSHKKKETPVAAKAQPAIAIEKIPSAAPTQPPAETSQMPAEKQPEVLAQNNAPVASKPDSQTPSAVTKLPDKHKAAEKPKTEEKKGFFSKLFGKKEEIKKTTKPTTEPSTDVIDKEIAEIPTDIEVEEKIEEEQIDEALSEIPSDIEKEAIAEKKTVAEQAEAIETGFFSKLKDAFTKKTLTPEKFDELFWDLELALLENNVAVEVIEKIKADLRDELTSGKVTRMGIEDMITARLRQSVEELFAVPTFDLVDRIKLQRKTQSEKPVALCIVGVNGGGKTTTIAKLVHLLKKQNLSVVVAASDTFRAAAIDQLREHTDRLDIKLISQGYGADPAAVAFDAIKHAQAKQNDVVIIDTAGRLHSNTNLMAELEKVVRVAKPDIKIFVGESITGNDCVEQAKAFDKLVGIDAIILSKADIDEKGGAAISVSYVTGKPIIYLGTGQTYDDLEPFDAAKVVANLELE